MGWRGGGWPENPAGHGMIDRGGAARFAGEVAVARRDSVAVERRGYVADDVAEALLREVTRLVARGQEGGVGGGLMAVVLHLSRLTPPAPRPHHRRVARALMQDTAGWYGGQLFSLGNGDLVLLCREDSGHAAVGRARATDPQALPQMLRHLLRVDTPPGLDLVSVWPLSSRINALQDYARARVARHEGSLVMEEDIAGQTGAVDVLGSFISSSAIADLLQRQSAILLSGGVDSHGGIKPLYHEVTFSIAGLEGRVATAAPVSSDPFLFRHLAGRLDMRMLEMLSQEAGGGGPLDIKRPGPPALHLNLTVQGILSESFARLVAVGGTAPGRVGVEVSLLEAVADSAAFARARAVLANSGCAFVLDGVSHLTLLMTRPGLFDAALIKLDWSPRLAELAEAEQGMIDRAMRDIGIHRIVLHRAETEAALRWGLSRGIRRFQGRHVDAMLGAARIVSCPDADGCTLRQCIERAGGANALSRSGCLNLPLLDAGAPSSADPLAVLTGAVSGVQPGSAAERVA